MCCIGVYVGIVYMYIKIKNKYVIMSYYNYLDKIMFKEKERERVKL